MHDFPHAEKSYATNIKIYEDLAANCIAYVCWKKMQQFIILNKLSRHTSRQNYLLSPDTNKHQRDINNKTAPTLSFVYLSTYLYIYKIHIYIYIYYIYIYIYIYIQVHEFLQSHCDDKLKGTFFS